MKTNTIAVFEMMDAFVLSLNNGFKFSHLESETEKRLKFFKQLSCIYNTETKYSHTFVIAIHIQLVKGSKIGRRKKENNWRKQLRGFHSFFCVHTIEYRSLEINKLKHNIFQLIYSIQWIGDNWLKREEKLFSKCNEKWKKKKKKHGNFPPNVSWIAIEC